MDQQWQKINITKRIGNVFSFTHTYVENKVWIALRYPYTFSYHKKYLGYLDNTPHSKQELLLATKQGRSIDILEITNSDLPNDDKKGIWICAREHGVEQDGSWVCQGMIDFLLSDSPVASYLRDKAVFVFIPFLTPDAAFNGSCVNPVTGYSLAIDFCPTKMRTSESRAILNQIYRWIASGNSLDICFSFHNPHGSEPNIWPFAYNNKNKKENKIFLKSIFYACTDYTKRRPTYRSSAPNFAGRCTAEFGTLSYIFEINHQAKKSFLTLDELREIGACFCRGIYHYLRSKEENNAYKFSLRGR